MNSYVARAGKHSIAFGMLWTLLPGAKSARSEIKKVAVEHQASAYVSLPVTGQKPLIGLLPEAAHLEKGASKKSANSAAAMLATAIPGIQNAVFGIVLPRGRVAFIGFRDGVPLIGFDRVIHNDSLEEVTADFLRELGNEPSTVEFHGSAELFAGRAVTPIDIKWFGDVSKKAVAATRLRGAKGLMAVWLVLALVVVVSYIGYDMYETQRKEALAKEKPVVPQDPNVLYTKSIDAYLATAGALGMEIAGPMINAINRLPMYHQGWNLEKVACTSAGSCVATWSNRDGGTYRSFNGSTLPGLAEFKTEYKEGLSTIDTTFMYPMDAPAGFKADVLPTQENFILFFGSQAQQMRSAGVAISIDKAVVVGMPPAEAGLPAVAEGDIKSPVLEGMWKLSGDWSFYQALTELPGNMTIVGIDIGVSGDAMSMNVTGKYYVKK